MLRLGLEVDFSRKLQNTGTGGRERCLRSCDVAEGSALYVGVRSAGVGVIEEVECFATDLEGYLLPDREVLEHRDAGVRRSGLED